MTSQQTASQSASRRSIACTILALLAALSAGAAAQSNYRASTRVSIVDGRWYLNHAVTHRGTPAEGLLMNARMVNAVFEDANPQTRPAGFDAEGNTDAFIAQLPDYVAHGVRAFTVGLQGGSSGYEGARNSAFDADGSLRESYLRRVARVIEACDRHGAVVILGLFYQRQDQVLQNDAAVRAAVVNAAKWISGRGFGNVVLDVANEYTHRGYDHPVLKTSAGLAELIRLVRRTAPGLLVSTSELGSPRGFPAGFLEEVVPECDFVLVHLNLTPRERIASRLAPLLKYGKPVVCNEDDKIGEEGAATARVCVAHGVSWGVMLVNRNQHYPFTFGGAADDLVIYGALKQLTTATPAEGRETRPYFPPADSQGGWRTAISPEEVRRRAGLNREKLDQAFEEYAAGTKNGGLLVLRHGWLAYEKYFGLGSREATPNLGSCGKSFTSIAVGILMAENPDLFPDGLDQKVFTPAHLPPIVFPLSDPAKAEIKLGHLLAFSAGIRGNNPGRAQGERVSLDPIGPDGWQAMVDAVAAGKRDIEIDGRTTSTATLWCRPGGGFSYASSSIHLASMMVRHVSGMELEEYVRTRLAANLGWGPFTYAYKNAPEVAHTPGGGGIAMRATDVLRFGYLLLHEGRWRDRQVVPAEYVRHCSRQSPYNPHSPYSLQFDVNSDGHIPDLPRDAFWKTGSGGHVLYVVPSLDLVVWKLAGRDSQYHPGNTGVPLPEASVKGGDLRHNWKPGAELGSIRLLQAIIGAVVVPPRTVASPDTPLPAGTLVIGKDGADGHVATGRDGAIHVVYGGRYRHGPSADRLGPEEAIADLKPMNLVRIAVDPVGQPQVVFSTGQSEKATRSYYTARTGGRWIPAEKIADASEIAGHSRAYVADVAADANGGVLVCYWISRPTGRRFEREVPAFHYRWRSPDGLT